MAAPQQPLPGVQGEPGLPATRLPLRPADRVFVSRVRDTGCGHTCSCTSDMECPHYECPCQYGEDPTP